MGCSGGCASSAKNRCGGFGRVWSELVNYFLTRWTLERGLIGSVSKKIESRGRKTFDNGDWNSRPRYGLAWPQS
jgi:hypothetical protein